MLVRILTEPKNALIPQYKALIGLDQVDLTFTDNAIKAIAKLAMERQTGARGLRSIMVSKIVSKFLSVSNELLKIFSLRYAFYLHFFFCLSLKFYSNLTLSNNAAFVILENKRQIFKFSLFREVLEFARFSLFMDYRILLQLFFECFLIIFFRNNFCSIPCLKCPARILRLCI